MSLPDLPRPKQPSFDRILRDYDSPHSVVNLVSPEVSRAIIELKTEYCDLTEEELEVIFKDPSPSVEQIRRLFWLEFDLACHSNQKMDMTRCYTGVCSRPAFYKMIKEESALAWIINPPKDYMIQTEELLAVGLKQIREIMKMPVKNAAGFVDTKLAEVKLKAVMMLDMRLKGGYVHRSVQVSHNVNKNESTVSYVEQAGAETGGNLSIDARIAELDQQIAAAERGGLPDSKPSIESSAAEIASTAIKLHNALDHIQGHAVARPAPRPDEIEDADFKESDE